MILPRTKKIFAAALFALSANAIAFAAPDAESVEVATEIAAEAAADQPTMILHVLSMFGLVLSVILLFAAAYVIISLRQIKKRLKKVNKLETDVKAITNEVHSLRAMRASENPVAVPKEAAEIADGPNIESSLWMPFIEKYNELSAQQGSADSKENLSQFAADNNIAALDCIDHDAKENNRPAPKFIAAKSALDGNFWAWQIPTTNGRFVIVPNPSKPYTENLHFEGGMKETFASNYEKNIEYKKLDVKLPAIFKNENDNWIIEQPGLIRLETDGEQ